MSRSASSATIEPSEEVKLSGKRKRSDESGMIVEKASEVGDRPRKESKTERETKSIPVRAMKQRKKKFGFAEFFAGFAGPSIAIAALMGR